MSTWNSAVLPRGDNQYLNENLMAALYFEQIGLDPNPVMLDVGAHYGGSLLRFIRNRWDVWAFEPDPKNRAKLFERLANEQALPRRVDTRAVSNVSGETLDFYSSEISAGISSLKPFHASHETHNQVETIRLDDFTSDFGIDRVDYLKIDIEGFDYFALQGFPFDRMRPQAILCEFEDHKTVPLGYDHVELGYFLANHGYQVLLSEWHPIVEYGQAHDWRQVREFDGTSAGDKSWGNYLCFSTPQNPAQLDKLVERSMRKKAPPAPSATPAPATTAPATTAPATTARATGESLEAQVAQLAEMLQEAVVVLDRHERELRANRSAVAGEESTS